MPIYEYKCLDCGSHFEKRQSVSDEPLKVCEKCEGSLEKQWSLSGFSFKGDGWYVTDYSKKNGGTTESAASGDKSSTAESTTSPETASKAKSEASSKTD